MLTTHYNKDITNSKMNRNVSADHRPCCTIDYYMTITQDFLLVEVSDRATGTGCRISGRRIGMMEQ
jgi:hypothetical protein